MANTVRVGASVDLGGLARDLDSIALGLAREVGKAVAAAAVPVAHAAAGLAPFDPNHRSKRKDASGKEYELGHIRDSFTARPMGPTTAAIVSTHPAAPVFEFGGTIAPKGTPIFIKPVEMAHKAAEANAALFERRVADHVDRLLAQHGL